MTPYTFRTQTSKFWKRYIENLSIFRNLAYLEREAYSEPWYLQKPRDIQNTEKIAT